MTVVGVRNYRLADTTPFPELDSLRYMYMSKDQIDGPRSGFEPIESLCFWKRLIMALMHWENRMISPYEWFRTSARMMRRMCTRPRSREVHARRTQVTKTCPYVFNALIRKCLNDDVLPSAYDEVTRAPQRDGADEKLDNTED